MQTRSSIQILRLSAFFFNLLFAALASLFPLGEERHARQGTYRVHTYAMQVRLWQHLLGVGLSLP